MLPRAAFCVGGPWRSSKVTRKGPLLWVPSHGSAGLVHPQCSLRREVLRESYALGHTCAAEGTLNDLSLSAMFSAGTVVSSVIFNCSLAVESYSSNISCKSLVGKNRQTSASSACRREMPSSSHFRAFASWSRLGPDSRTKGARLSFPATWKPLCYSRPKEEPVFPSQCPS